MIEIGDEVATVQPGDRVVVPFQISCGTCASCVAGFTAHCVEVPPLSMYGFGLTGGLWGGAIADLMAVPYAAYRSFRGGGARRLTSYDE